MAYPCGRSHVTGFTAPPWWWWRASAAFTPSPWRAAGASLHVVTVVETVAMPRGGGSRHSKNAGTMGSENLTYGERKALGFGTMKERLGKETVKDFDACALGLTHAKVRHITVASTLPSVCAGATTPRDVRE